MKILVVPSELPLPANSGGRIDVWRRLRLLQAQGHELALLSWHNVARDGPLPATVSDELATVCATHRLAWIRRTSVENLKRLACMVSMPSHAAARWVTLDRVGVLSWARSFAPDVILLDGLWGVAAARWLAAQMGCPWVYRSHNIEHVYMRQQQARALGWKSRLALRANLFGLRRLEEAVVRDAACVYDISVVDAEHWQSAGHQHVRWLPTVVDADFVAAMETASSQRPVWDLAFFGNLNTPNNVEAVAWLVERVLPRLDQVDLRVVIAGSRPSAKVRCLAAGDARITLLADPPSMAAVAGAARVLVNPIQVGSGVNLKSVEMLFSSAHLVSTPGGVQGMTSSAARCFAVHADVEGFAAAIEAALHREVLVSAPPDRLAAREPFSPVHAAAVLQGTLQSLAAQRRT